MKLLPSLAATVSLAAVLAFSPATLRADDAGKKAAAEALLKTMRVEQMIATQMDQAKAQMAGAISGASQGSGASADQVAAMQKRQSDAMSFLQEKLSWNSLKPDMVQAYADTFSEPELKDLNAFYMQPIGQKFLDKQPQLTAKVGQVMQQRVMAIMPEMMQKMRAGGQ